MLHRQAGCLGNAHYFELRVFFATMLMVTAPAPRQPLSLQPPLVPHFLFNCLALGSIEAAATISGAELDREIRAD